MGTLHRFPPAAMSQEDETPTLPMFGELGDEHFDQVVRDDTKIGPAGLLVIAVVVVSCIAYWTIAGV
jgi:hypothetical protein